jgi:AraC-like DNA-binding protein
VFHVPTTGALVAGAHDRELGVRATVECGDSGFRHAKQAHQETSMLESSNKLPQTGAGVAYLNPPEDVMATMLSRVDNLTSQVKLPPGAIVAGFGDVGDRGDLRVPVRGGLPPRALRRVCDYILSHLAENISNHVMAEFVGLSDFHFTRAFKQSTGVTPHRFVLQSRVDRVKQLLVETELPVVQIALAAGFADQSHCARWFRELVGMTPSRFRWLRR